MAGRGFAPHPMIPARGQLGGPGGHRAGPGGFGSGMRPLGLGLDVEEKLATQHAEIQRLLTENQRLAATHVALRQELAAAQQQVQQLQQILSGFQADKEQQFRGIAEKSAKMEAELRALEPLKLDLQRVQADGQKLLASRQDLTIQVQQLTQELQRIRADAQHVPAMKSEIDGLRQEIQRARTAFEFEKNANTDLLDQRGAMEKNLVSMAREVEKLRAELTNVEKKGRASGYGGGYGSEMAYSSVPSYGESYGMSQVGAAADSGVPYGSAAIPSWGAYEMQRGGARR